MWSPHRMSSFCCGRAGMLWDYLQVPGPAGLWALGCRPCPEFTVLTCHRIYRMEETCSWTPGFPTAGAWTAAFLMAAFMGRCLPMSVHRFQRQLWVRYPWGCGQSLGICLYMMSVSIPKKRKELRGQRDSSAVRSTHCSCWRTGFSS